MSHIFVLSFVSVGIFFAAISTHYFASHDALASIFCLVIAALSKTADGCVLQSNSCDGKQCYNLCNGHGAESKLKQSVRVFWS